MATQFKHINSLSVQSHKSWKLRLVTHIWDFRRLYGSYALVALPSLVLWLKLSRDADHAVSTTILGCLVVLIATAIYILRRWHIKHPDQVAEIRDEADVKHDLSLIRQSWQEICQSLGWLSTETPVRGTRFGLRGETPIEQKRPVYPTLIDAHIHDDRKGHTIVIRPPAHFDEDKRSKMAETWRRAVDASFVDHQDHGAKLVITTRHQDIPRHINFPYEYQPNGWNDFIIGVDGRGQIVRWNPSDSPHLLIAGSTNMGKGVAVRSIMFQALRLRYKVTVLNPKLSGEFLWAKQYQATVVSELEAMVEAIQAVEAERLKRQQFLEEHGYGSWLDLPDQHRWHPQLLVLDEAPRLLMPNKADKAEEKLHLEAGSLIYKLAAMARSVGIFLIFTAQRPDANALGPNGGAIRHDLIGRMIVGHIDEDGWAMMIGHKDKSLLHRLNGIKGRTIATQLASGMTTITFQSYYLSEIDLRDGTWKQKPTSPPGVAPPSNPISLLTDDITTKFETYLKSRTAPKAETVEPTLFVDPTLNPLNEYLTCYDPELIKPLHFDLDPTRIFGLVNDTEPKPESNIFIPEPPIIKYTKVTPPPIIDVGRQSPIDWTQNFIANLFPDKDKDQ